MSSTVSKYGFNAYDTVIALILTQYLEDRDYKAELGKVVSASLSMKVVSNKYLLKNDG